MKFNSHTMDVITNNEEIITITIETDRFGEVIDLVHEDAFELLEEFIQDCGHGYFDYSISVGKTQYVTEAGRYSVEALFYELEQHFEDLTE